MRLTKQLTARVAAILLIIGTCGTATLAEQPCKDVATDDLGEAWERAERQFMTRLFGGGINKRDCPEAIYLDAVGPPFPLKGLDPARAANIKIAEGLIWANDLLIDEYYYNKQEIVGETIDGIQMTIHCNPGACTLGSLNRFSVLTGAPMMVPAVMLKRARDVLSDGVRSLDERSVWKTVADVIWTDPQTLAYTYEKRDTGAFVENIKLEGDVNGIRAKAIYDADPTAYATKQKAFIASAHIENKVGVLITKGFVSTAETGDPGVVVSTDDDEVVVTETVVTCTSQGQTDCVDAHDQ